MMDDWMTTADMTIVAAGELESALDNAGVINYSVEADEEAETVTVVFGGHEDAAAFLTLTIDADHTPGSLYDRVSGGYVTVGDAAERDVELSEYEMEDLFESSWRWRTRPHLTGRRVHWHLAVDIPAEDAIYVTTVLNGIVRGAL